MSMSACREGRKATGRSDDDDMPCPIESPNKKKLVPLLSSFLFFILSSFFLPLNSFFPLSPLLVSLHVLNFFVPSLFSFPLSVVFFLSSPFSPFSPSPLISIQYNDPSYLLVCCFSLAVIYFFSLYLSVIFSCSLFPI